MISALTAFEKKSMLRNSDIRIDTRESTKKSVHDVANLKVSLVDRGDLSKTGIEVLKFNKFTTDYATIITRLKKIDTSITDLQDIYIAICEEAIKKFVRLAEESKIRRLTIFTSDPFIHEILLKEQFFILPTKSEASDSDELFAWKIFK